jgi:ferredoxin-NADP reductase
MAAREYRCEVKGFRNLTPTVFEVAFETDHPVEFEGGQFFSVIIPGAGPHGRDLRRAYSIASPPEKRPIELCVKLVEGGPGTNYLAKLKPGDVFRVMAPYGDFVFEPKQGRHACFIATGTGIAPFRSMIFSKAYRTKPPASTTCLLGVRDEAELLYMGEFGDDSSVNWVPALSRPTTAEWKGFRGRVTDWFRQQGDAYPWLETEYYLCGGGAMIDEIKAILLERGVVKESIHQEIYYKAPKAPAGEANAVKA